MSTQQYHRSLLKELERINNTIDYKILRGRPYKKEARRHRMLLSTLRRVQSV